jgi:ankyrin repeat protein
VNERTKEMTKEMSLEQRLIYACENGDLDKVKQLIKQGVDIHAGDDYALRLAANGHFDVIKYLVEHGANIHADNDRALQVAAGNGHHKVVNYLNSIIQQPSKATETASVEYPKQYLTLRDLKPGQWAKIVGHAKDIIVWRSSDPESSAIFNFNTNEHYDITKYDLGCQAPEIELLPNGSIVKIPVNNN